MGGGAHGGHIFSMGGTCPPPRGYAPVQEIWTYYQVVKIFIQFILVAMPNPKNTSCIIDNLMYIWCKTFVFQLIHIQSETARGRKMECSLNIMSAILERISFLFFQTKWSILGVSFCMLGNQHSDSQFNVQVQVVFVECNWIFEYVDNITVTLQRGNISSWVILSYLCMYLCIYV